jgi:hypothetical protein
VEDLVFNTEHGFHPTRFAYMTPMRIEQELSKDIHKSGNALVKATRFVTPKSIEAWRAFMGNNTLDRMTGFSDEMAQHTILNMYSYHEQCSRDIVEEETSSGRTFDYIISTREDIYFFHPLDLTVLLEHEGRLGLHVGVVGGKVVGEEFAVLKNLINRLAEKTSLATKPPDRRTVAGLVIADDGIRLECHSEDAMRSPRLREGN